MNRMFRPHQGLGRNLRGDFVQQLLSTPTAAELRASLEDKHSTVERIQRQLAAITEPNHGDSPSR